jgi:hypothetical protein
MIDIDGDEGNELEEQSIKDSKRYVESENANEDIDDDFAQESIQTGKI